MAYPARVNALSVLVPEAHALGMLAAIRSLGLAGYRVHTASPQPDAIGFASRFAAVRTVCPDFGSSAYADWLRRYTSGQGIAAIVPGGAFLLAIEPFFEEFRHFLPLAQDRQVVYRALSKVEVFEAFRDAPASSRLLDHHPRSLAIDRAALPISEAAVGQLGDVVYLKGDARHAVAGRDDLLCGPLRPSDAVDTVRRALGAYRKVLMQGGVEGRQAGVSLLVNGRGEALASNCFIDVHLEATRRGTMSLRRTWRNPRLVEDALQRLRCLGWQGAAMLEYRVRDDDGSFDFIELNPRYWQSLHLDLLAGVDFPRLQMAWFEERPLPPPPLPKDVVCRDFWPGEISRMLEIWRSPRFGTGYRLRESFTFLARLLDPAVASDYAFPGDRRVYWHRVAQVAGGWLRHRRQPRRPVAQSR
jgi:hypothetical protein